MKQGHQNIAFYWFDKLTRSELWLQQNLDSPSWLSGCLSELVNLGLIHLLLSILRLFLTASSGSCHGGKVRDYFLGVLSLPSSWFSSVKVHVIGEKVIMWQEGEKGGLSLEKMWPCDSKKKWEVSYWRKGDRTYDIKLVVFFVPLLY